VKQAFHTVRMSTHGTGLCEFTDFAVELAWSQKIVLHFIGN